MNNPNPTPKLTADDLAFLKEYNLRFECGSAGWCVKELVGQNWFNINQNGSCTDTDPRKAMDKAKSFWYFAG